MQKPSLYGITHSNRDFSDPYYWGKNQFNSAFPVALSCYMRDTGIKAVYLRLNEKCQVYHDELSISDMFGTALPNDQLFFSFESRYEPYKKFVHDELETIDLVIKKEGAEECIRSLEVKLTTLPDNTTESFSEEEYGCELVIRSPTMRYMALSMVEPLAEHFKAIRDIFEPVCFDIRDWDNGTEIKQKLPKMLEALEKFIGAYASHEQPLLMQPIWKTIGKSPKLADNCLDIFVWSNFALTRLFIDSAKASEAARISRQQRAAIRLTRFLLEISQKEKIYQQPIYDGMTYGHQTDKEFAISGNRTHAYMKCPRLSKPIIHKNKIKEIILGGGQKHLSPERRFDAILYFSKDLFE